MIDLVHNGATGVHVVHDEPDLDEVRSVVVDNEGYCTFVSERFSKRSERRLPEDLLAAIRWTTRCSMIRMDGTTPVSDRTVRLRHEH